MPRRVWAAQASSNSDRSNDWFAARLSFISFPARCDFFQSVGRAKPGNSPFAARYAPSSGPAGWRFLFSILFPVSILVCYFGKLRDNPVLLLALIGFTVAAFQAYFLAEGGNRFYDGNFLWGAEVMLFIWFVISARELFNVLFDGKKCNREKIILSGIYLSHLAAGIAYYGYCFLSTTYA